MSKDGENLLRFINRRHDDRSNNALVGFPHSGSPEGSMLSPDFEARILLLGQGWTYYRKQTRVHGELDLLDASVTGRALSQDTLIPLTKQDSLSFSEERVRCQRASLA